MLSKNREKFLFGFGLCSSIISLISLIFLSIGVALPSWYRETNSNNTILLAEANLFYSCFASTISSTSLTCTSYESYQCSTMSYQKKIWNITSILPGCVNPINGSSMYLTFDGPIYQIDLDDFYRIRTAAILAILAIILTFFTLILGILMTWIVLHRYVIILAPIAALISVIFGVCSLITTASVFSYSGSGFALFAVGILLDIFVLLFLSISFGWSIQMNKENPSKDQEPFEIQRGRSPIIIRRIHTRRL